MVLQAASLFVLAAAALQACAYPATNQFQVKVNSAIHADSLINIHLDYAPTTAAKDLTITFGACSSNATSYQVGNVKISADYQPKKFVWHVPEGLHGTEDACFQAWTKDNDGKSELAGQSEVHNVTKKVSKRGHPELADMYFDAVSYYKKNFAKRSSFAVEDKSNTSKYRKLSQIHLTPRLISSIHPY
jgi:hypothetical protein